MLYNDNNKQIEYLYKKVITMDNKIEEILEIFGHTKTLSDIIIWSHLILEKESVFDLSLFQNSGDHKRFEHDIDIKTRFVMNGLISVKEYKNELFHMMLDGDTPDKDKLIQVCLGLIVSYERTSLSDKKYLDTLIEEDATFCDYKIYFNPIPGLLNQPNEKDRKGSLYDKKDLNYLYRTFFIKKTELGLPIEIKYYKTKEFDEQMDRIRVSVCPIKGEEWFDYKTKECPFFNLDGSFEIFDRKEDLNNNNNAIVNAIESASEQNADIIIFPEITMNQETEQMVRKWLAGQKLRGHDVGVKLVFLGSVWKNNQNACSLLSNTGKVILRNQKIHPFEFCEKGKRFLEKLEPPKNEPLTIVDIDGLGRITYLICRDALENVDQSHIWHSYKINGEFISAYSRSISYFKRISRNFAETNHGYTFLVNSCAARKNKDQLVGYLSTPGRNLKEENASDVIFHGYNKNGCEESCEFASCQFIFELKFKESQVYNKDHKEVESITVTSEKYSI